MYVCYLLSAIKKDNIPLRFKSHAENSSPFIMEIWVTDIFLLLIQNAASLPVLPLGNFK